MLLSVTRYDLFWRLLFFKLTVTPPCLLCPCWHCLMLKINASDTCVLMKQPGYDSCECTHTTHSWNNDNTTAQCLWLAFFSGHLLSVCESFRAHILLFLFWQRSFKTDPTNDSLPFVDFPGSYTISEEFWLAVASVTLRAFSHLPYIVWLNRTLELLPQMNLGHTKRPNPSPPVWCGLSFTGQGPLH